MVYLKRLIPVLLVLALGLIPMPVAAEERNMAFVDQDVNLAPGQVFGSDLAIVAANAAIAQGALVAGNLTVVGGTARIEGVIEGNAVVLGGSMVLGPQAWVQGDVVVAGTLSRDPAAQVDGAVVVTSEHSYRLQEMREGLLDQRVLPDGRIGDPEGWAQRLPWVSGFAQLLASLLGMGIVALLVTVALPTSLPHVSEVMGRTALLCIAVGLVTALAAALLLPVLVILIVGIPVALVLLLGLALAVLCGWVAAAHLVGHRLLRLLSAAAPNVLLQVLVGVVTLGLALRIPCLGAFIAGVVACWGLGAVMLTRFGTSKNLVWAPFEPLAATAGLPPQPVPAEPTWGGGTKRLSPKDLEEDLKTE